MSRKSLNLLLAAIVGSVVTACSLTQSPKSCGDTSAPVQEASAPVVAVASEPIISSAPVVMNHNSVYFAFDKYDVKDGYRGVVQTNANYITSNPQALVQIQGNTDDIGSVEYNLSLGQRRADAVKKALIADGVDRNHIEAVSYGKLKPKYPNDTAASRAQNRRSDIVYKSAQPQGYSVDSSNELPMIDGNFYNGTVIEGVQ